MHCTNCGADITAWLLKYKAEKKLRLDDLYFKEAKILPKWDETGLYIEGQKFYDHEKEKAKERCPKCSSKNSIVEEDVSWAPI